MNSNMSDEMVTKIEYTNFDNLEDFQNDYNYEIAVTNCYTALNDVQSTDWLSQYNSLMVLRRLNKHESKAFEAIFDKLLFNIVKLAASIRTNIAKQALILCGEVFYTHNYGTKSLKQLVPAVLAQSAHLKQFIKDEAQNALIMLGKCKANTFDIIQLLSEGITNKNLTISESSLNTLLSFIRNCNLYDIQNDEWRSMLISVVNIYGLKKDIYTKKAVKVLAVYQDVLEDSFDSVVKYLPSECQSVVNTIRREIASKTMKNSKTSFKDLMNKK
jgi:hypothetical protein